MLGCQPFSFDDDGDDNHDENDDGDDDDSGNYDDDGEARVMTVPRMGAPGANKRRQFCVLERHEPTSLERFQISSVTHGCPGDPYLCLLNLIGVL